MTDEPGYRPYIQCCNHCGHQKPDSDQGPCPGRHTAGFSFVRFADDPEAVATLAPEADPEATPAKVKPKKSKGEKPIPLFPEPIP